MGDSIYSLLGTRINPHVHRLSPLLVRCPLIYPLFAYRKPDAQTTKTASMRSCKGSQLYLRFKKISIFPMDFQNVLILVGCVCRYASCVSVCLLNIKLKLDWYPNENSGISWILFIFKSKVGNCYEFILSIQFVKECWNYFFLDCDGICILYQSICLLHAIWSCNIDFINWKMLGV